MPARATREGPDTLLSAILPVPQRELPRSPPKLPHTMKEVGLPAGDCCEQRKVLEGAEGDTNRRGGGGARGVKRSGSQCGTVCSLWLRDDACLGGLLERNPAVGSLRALLAARLPVGARRLRWRLRVRACVRACVVARCRARVVPVSSCWGGQERVGRERRVRQSFSGLRVRRRLWRSILGGAHQGGGALHTGVAFIWRGVSTCMPTGQGRRLHCGKEAAPPEQPQ